MANDESKRNWEALTGVGFVALVVAAMAVPGEPPKTDSAASEVVRNFTDKRSEVLASSSLWFLAAILSTHRGMAAGNSGAGRGDHQRREPGHSCRLPDSNVRPRRYRPHRLRYCSPQLGRVSRDRIRCATR